MSVLKTKQRHENAHRRYSTTYKKKNTHLQGLRQLRETFWKMKILHLAKEPWDLDLIYPIYELVFKH